MAGELFTLVELNAWAQTQVPQATAELALQLVTGEIRRAVGPARYDALADRSPLKLIALDLAKRMIRNAEGKRSTSRQVDDYVETNTYATETLAPPELTDADLARIWRALGLEEPSRAAFTIRPVGVPDPPGWCGYRW